MRLLHPQPALFQRLNIEQQRSVGLGGSQGGGLRHKLARKGKSGLHSCLLTLSNSYYEACRGDQCQHDAIMASILLRRAVLRINDDARSFSRHASI